MGTRLVIDGNSVYEIDETCQKAGRNMWAGGRRGNRKPWGREEDEEGGHNSSGRYGRLSH